MSELSPAAFAVVNAFVCAHARKSHPSSNADIAAALRAARYELAPCKTIKDIDYVSQSYVNGYEEALDEILAIATELEAQ